MDTHLLAFVGKDNFDEVPLGLGWGKKSTDLGMSVSSSEIVLVGIRG